MTKSTRLTPDAANKKIRQVLARGIRRAKEKTEDRENKQRTKSQYVKYKSGAAKSPTPPPRASAKRDRKTLDVVRVVELECTDAGGSVVVAWLAEKFLFEQNRLDNDKASVEHKTTDELFEDWKRASKRMDKKAQNTLQSRIKLRENLITAPVRVYGWDKTTSLLRSAFISMAMSPSETIPFTCNLSKEVSDRSEAAKGSFASHLQSRFQKILKRSFVGTVPQFWFVVEVGTSSGFHLHGAIECGRGSEVQAKVKSALQTLGGLNDKRSVKLSPAGPRVGWCHYVTKHAAYNQFVIGGSWFASTRECARRGKEMYTEFWRDARRLER